METYSTWVSPNIVCVYGLRNNICKININVINCDINTELNKIKNAYIIFIFFIPINFTKLLFPYTNLNNFCQTSEKKIRMSNSSFYLNYIVMRI